jgi:hypothetical protein
MASTWKPRPAPASRSSAKSPARPAPKREIIADDQLPYAQRADQYPCDELFGAQGGEARIEAADVREVDAVVGEQLEFFRAAWTGRGGADSGAKNSRGWGSKVSTAAGRPAFAAAAFRRASSAR